MPAVTPPRVLVALAVVLLGDVFLLAGDRADVVTPGEAVAAFRRTDVLPGLPPLPRTGVYLYDTTGYESVNRLSIRRAYPAVSVRVVTSRLGCAWREEVVLFDEHRETYDVCADGTDVRDVAFGTRLSYYWVGATTSLRCGTGGSRVGSGPRTVTYACDGGGVHADVTAVYEGISSADVEGVPVPCARVVVTTVLTGTNVGGARRALCTDPRNGLVLTEERSVGVTVRSAFVGRVTYTERATFRLRSLTPLT